MTTKRTVLSRLTFTNWGNSGNSHENITFSDESNLFTGANGSGKSSTLDALLAVLFGSFSSQNFNLGKKTTSKEKSRTALTYLKGSRKSWVALREDVDFYANVVAEFWDQETNEYYCGGAIFKVPADETSNIPEHQFFSINGPFPEDEFINYDYEKLDQLIEERAREYENIKPFVCKKYTTGSAYTNVLMNQIFGGVDSDTFVKLQKSSISATMPENGSTEDFIREYLFTKPDSNACESIVSKAKNIKRMEKLLQAKKKVVDMLNSIVEKIDKAEELEDVIREHNAVTENIKVLTCKNILKSLGEKLDQLYSESKALQKRENELDQKKDAITHDIFETQHAINNSQYGLMQQQLNLKRDTLEFKRKSISQWRDVLGRLKKWFEDDELPVPPSVESIYEQLSAADIQEEYFDSLKMLLKNAHAEIEEEYQDIFNERKEILAKKEQLKTELESFKKNEYLYRNKDVKNIARLLQERLTDLHTGKIEVRIFSRTFEISNEEWRNAIEGRLGAKSYLIVDPRYYDIAHKEFKKMNTRGVHLIDSKKMVEKNVSPMPNSLYECVKTTESYIDAALRYYLGKIIMCDSIEDFKHCENGVMKDCFAYNQRSSYQLNVEDYTKYASIGLKVSQKMLSQKAEEIQKIEEKLSSVNKEYYRLLTARDLDTFERNDSKHLCEVGTEATSVTFLEAEIASLETQIEALKNGEIEKLNRRVDSLKKEKVDVENEKKDVHNKVIEIANKIGSQEKDKSELESKLNDLYETKDEVVIEKANSWYKQKCRKDSQLEWVSQIRANEIADISSDFEKKKRELDREKGNFSEENPSYGLEDNWFSNEQFKVVCKRENEEYKETTIREYAKMYEETLEELKQNVIDQLNRNIKNAKSYATKINMQLRKHLFGNNYFVIEISKAENEYGDYYHMLTSESLNLKVPQEEDGQLDLGIISLNREYGRELDAFTKLFIPPEEEDFNGNYAYFEDAQAKFKDKLDKLTDYRTYLRFDMKARVDANVVDEESKKMLKESSSVDTTASSDSGGEEVSPKYVALLMGFKMMYEEMQGRKSKMSIVLMDEAFSKLDIRRTREIILCAKELGLQLVMCAPDKEGIAIKDLVNRTIYFRTNLFEQCHIQQLNIHKGGKH